MFSDPEENKNKTNKTNLKSPETPPFKNYYKILRRTPALAKQKKTASKISVSPKDRHSRNYKNENSASLTLIHTRTCAPLLSLSL